MNRRVLFGCGGALILSICILIAGIGAILIGFQPEEPGDVRIQLRAPDSVPRGEPFAVEIEITNVFTGVQILDSIDISLDYLNYISVQQSRPPASDSFEIPFVQFVSYTFEEEINMLETKTVVFEMVGEEEGFYAGEIDVCINKASSCKTLEIETTIGIEPGR